MKCKRLTALMLCLCLMAISGGAVGEIAVERREGEAYFPNEKEWVYHFVYAYPHLTGEDYCSAAVNDTYEMALDEMLLLVLPMFSNAPDMRYGGHNEVEHDFDVKCNNGRALSIVQKRVQRLGGENGRYALEPLTFGVSGVYEGEALTLRGVILLQAGVDPEMLDEAEAELYPEIARIIDGSSTELSDALQPVLFAECEKLQEAGVIRADVTWETFLEECLPSSDFYTDDAGNLIFFFQPALLNEPSFDVPAFSFTPAELNTLLLAADGASVQPGDYVGRYSNGSYDQVVIEKTGEDYAMEVTLYRLAYLDEGTVAFSDDGVVFCTADGAGNPLILSFYQDGPDRYALRVVESAWEYLEPGTVYDDMVRMEDSTAYPDP